MYYLFLSIPKTGSSMLCNMLDGHPALACPKQYLERPDFSPRWREALDELEQKTGRKTVGHCHAKRATRDMLEAKDAWRLVITRDPIASALSRLRIEYEPAVGEWIIPPQVFAAEVEYRRKETKRLLLHADEAVSYEELTGGLPTTEADRTVSEKLCRFFGVEVLQLKTLVKKNKPAFPVNWDKLRG